MCHGLVRPAATVVTRIRCCVPWGQAPCAWPFGEHGPGVYESKIIDWPGAALGLCWALAIQDAKAQRMMATLGHLRERSAMMGPLCCNWMSAVDVRSSSLAYWLRT